MCWGCGEEGHLRPYCPNLKKSSSNTQKTQEGSKPEAKVVTTSVVEISSNDEGAWATKEVRLEVEMDWFEEVVEAKVKHMENVSGRIEEEIGNVLVEDIFGDISGEVFVAAETVQASAKTELYDSGCTNHISPYKSDFNNFQTIETRHFCAANKQTLSTIGKGELVVDIPVQPNSGS